VSGSSCKKTLIAFCFLSVFSEDQGAQWELECLKVQYKYIYNWNCQWRAASIDANLYVPSSQTLKAPHSYGIHEHRLVGKAANRFMAKKRKAPKLRIGHQETLKIYEPPINQCNKQLSLFRYTVQVIVKNNKALCTGEE
jgi:hypothetical protein